MKALSIWQPWASLLVAGIKAYETRRWSPPVDLMGQRIALHAARTEHGLRIFCDQMVNASTAMHRWAAGLRLGLPQVDLPHGCLLGTAILAFALKTDSPLVAGDLPQETALGDWSPGRWAWRLTDPEPLPEPIPWRGQQGLFSVPDHILTQGSTP